MPKAEIDAFLAGGATASPAAEEPAPAAPADSTPAADTKPPEAPAKAAPAPEADDAEPPDVREGDPIVPRAAYEAERKRRQDYKAQAAKLEGELAELRRQTEEAKRAAQQPSPQYQPPPQPIDPVNDPQGFVQRVQTAMLNERLNNSEMFLREKLGTEKVDGLIAEFKQAAQADPALYQKMYQQPNPYGWMAREVDRLKLIREVDDPAAYRAKIVAEERAKWEAEMAAQAPPPPPVSPAAGQPRSLATARNVAPRSAPAWTGPTPLTDIARRG